VELELDRVKRELAQVKLELDILKNRRVLCRGVAARYAVIKSFDAITLFLCSAGPWMYPQAGTTRV